jgi:DNA adenine methylase
LVASRVKQPLKTFGGKKYLAPQIVALMPRHKHYVEPFAGGLAVLLARDPMDERLFWPDTVGVSEVVNDVHQDLTAFWKVMRDEKMFRQFLRRVEGTPFSETAYKEAAEMIEAGEFDSVVTQAWAFFVCCRQSLAGRMAGFTGITKTRTRAGMNNEVSAWLSAVEGLPAVHERLKRVLVLDGRDGADVIRSQDAESTLYYIDAPYIASTRTAPKVYRHEMSDDDHARLIQTLVLIEGKAMVSHYRHPVYDALHERHGWRRVDFDLANHASGAKLKRRVVESLWMNYDPENSR